MDRVACKVQCTNSTAAVRSTLIAVRLRVAAAAASRPKNGGAALWLAQAALNRVADHLRRTRDGQGTLKHARSSLWQRCIEKGGESCENRS